MVLPAAPPRPVPAIWWPWEPGAVRLWLPQGTACCRARPFSEKYRGRGEARTCRISVLRPARGTRVSSWTISITPTVLHRGWRRRQIQCHFICKGSKNSCGPQGLRSHGESPPCILNSPRYFNVFLSRPFTNTLSINLHQIKGLFSISFCEGRILYDLSDLYWDQS